MRLVALLAQLALLALGCSSNDDIPAPSLASLTPDSGASGTVVNLAGSFLCQEVPPDNGGGDTGTFDCDSDGVVMFGTSPATATSVWMDDGVSIEVPELEPGVIDVTVSSAGRLSNTISFTVE